MTEKRRTRPTYSPEFKRQALKKCEEIGIKKTSQELGVSPASLRSWKLQADKNGKVQPGKPSYAELEEEVERLKRELGYVSDINKILKKSTAIFSKSELDGSR